MMFSGDGSSVTLNVQVPAGQQPATVSSTSGVAGLSTGRAVLGVNVPLTLNASVHAIASGFGSIVSTSGPSSPTPQAATRSIEKTTQVPAFCAMPQLKATPMPGAK